MSKKSIENKFSIDMDAYFKGIEDNNKLQSKEYNEILELGKTLADKDFSKSSNKEAVFSKVLKNINENINENKGENSMKKLNKFKRPAVAAAVVGIMSISLMQTSFGQGFVEKVVNKISVGHISAVQVEPSTIKVVSIPQELKGKVFDKNGKEIKVFSRENAGKYYTAAGEKIASMSKGKIITETEEQKMEQEKNLIVKDSKKLNDYTCFNVVLPNYLPDGYKFDRAEFYKDENGLVSNTKYANLYFTNEKTGKYIYMQQRFADKETAYEMGTEGKIEKIKINGVDAIISKDKNIDWETDGVLYGLLGRGEITRSELIKIAESILKTE